MSDATPITKIKLGTCFVTDRGESVTVTEIEVVQSPISREWKTQIELTRDDKVAVTFELPHLLDTIARAPWTLAFSGK